MARPGSSAPLPRWRCSTTTNTHMQRLGNSSIGLAPALGYPLVLVCDHSLSRISSLFIKNGGRRGRHAVAALQYQPRTQACTDAKSASSVRALCGSACLCPMLIVVSPAPPRVAGPRGVYKGRVWVVILTHFRLHFLPSTFSSLFVLHFFFYFPLSTSLQFRPFPR